MCVFVATATGVAMAGSTAATTTTVMTASQMAMQATYASMAMMANVSLATTALSTGMQMYGSYQQSKAQKAQAEYQSAVSRNNQIVAERNAEDAIKRGEEAEKRHRLKVEQLKGTQRSVLAGTGFDVNEDDALDILADTAEMGELDGLTIRHNAKREAYGHKVQAMNDGAQAGLYQAKADAQSPLLAAGTELFNGAGSVANKWYSYKQGFGYA